jgi:hypothetical protein
MKFVRLRFSASASFCRSAFRASSRRMENGRVRFTPEWITLQNYVATHEELIELQLGKPFGGLAACATLRYISQRLGPETIS